MNRPISDNPDDLDRTDRLPVIGAGESTDEFPAFDPAATVVLDRASHDRLRAAEEQLSQLQVRLVERENENGDLRATLAGRAESQAALEARAEMLRAQLTDRDEEIGPLRASAIRLVELERLHAALQAEQATARDELARVRAELEAWRAEASRGVTEGQALRAGLEAEIDRRSAELRQARDELATRLAAQADVESRRAELAAQLASTRAAAESELATTRARLEAEVTALRARLESELLAARTTHESQLGAVRDRLEGELAAARAELAAERDAQAALRVAQTAIEEQRLKDAARQGDESAQLQLVVAGLQRELAAARDAHQVLERELAAARDAHQVLERELAAARRESARAAAGLAGLEGQLRDRDLQVETLLERLRTREARGRFDQELRDSSRAAAERALTTLRLPDRLAALEQSMASRVAAAERSETQLAELLHRLAAERALHAESAAASARAAADAAAAQTAARDTARVAAEQAGQLAEIVAVARAAIEAAASQQASLAAEAAARAEAEAEARARAEAEAISRAMEESAAKARAEADARERERAANAAANAATRYLTRLDDESGIVFILSSPRVVVGRGRNCDLQIVESFISGRHALLRLGPDVTIVEDTGSTNGTFVNSKRVQREALRDGDVVSFGRARFRFHARPLLPPPQ